MTPGSIVRLMVSGKTYAALRWCARTYYKPVVAQTNVQSSRNSPVKRPPQELCRRKEMKVGVGCEGLKPAIGPQKSRHTLYRGHDGVYLCRKSSSIQFGLAKETILKSIKPVMLIVALDQQVVRQHLYDPN